MVTEVAPPRRPATFAAPDRRAQILDAAGRVLLRHGLRKSSVDEVARAAHVSRQGLYLHFATKDELFGAAVEHLLASTCDAQKAELSRPGVSLERRLLAAFEAIAESSLGDGLDEVLEAAERLTGRTSADLEGDLVDGFAHALSEASSSSAWHRHGDSAHEVATLLYATSAGLKRLPVSMPEYRRHMRRAIRLACG